MKLNNQVIVQKLGDTFVAYDNNHSILHEFNEVGHKILDMIEKGYTKNKMVMEIVSEFDVSKNQALGDVEDFVEVLVKKDLITL